MDGVHRGAQATTKGDPATGLTRDRWLLILFAELGYGRLPPANAVEIDGLSFPVSHAWGSAPIHLVGAGLEMDRRTPGVPGAARSSPHSLVQELLNRDPSRLWGFVSNGLRLRLLRDNLSLTRQASIEFDLQAMMDGEIYSDFVVLWLLAHQSRFEATEPESTGWSVGASRRAARAPGHSTISATASRKPSSPSGPASSTTGPTEISGRSSRRRSPPARLLPPTPSSHLRLLFLLVSEERDPSGPRTDEQMSRRYRDYYSMGRFRELAERRRGTRHDDLWVQIRSVVKILGPPKAVLSRAAGLGQFPVLGSATPALNNAQITNRDLLNAISALSGRNDEGYASATTTGILVSRSSGACTSRSWSFTQKSTYPPSIRVDPRWLRATHNRSHYTPPGILKQVSIRPRAGHRRGSGREPDAALLDLRVLDPAAGSGHFFYAAAHRVARALASVRTGELEATPHEVRAALHEVVAPGCVYGTDLNPMAVELCRVALWLETLEPGKPLTFLDHHIRVGNSLLGRASWRQPWHATAQRSTPGAENLSSRSQTSQPNSSSCRRSTPRPPPSAASLLQHDEL